MPAKFPEDSYDVMERTYGNVICSGFPSYAKFWELFIGRDLSTKTRMWYVFELPPSISARDRQITDEWREEISMAHYSLFCSIAGAYFQMAELNKLLPIIEINNTIFVKHWEAFECFYSRLGISYFQVFHLWDCLALWEKGISRAEALQMGRREKAIIRTDFILKIGHKDEWDMFKLSHDDFKIVRDNLTHFSSHFSHKFRHGYFSIPAIINKNELWTAQRNKADWRRTNVTMQRDLELSEKTFDSVHVAFIGAFGKEITRRGIKIKS
jgi:hypothetical protein